MMNKKINEGEEMNRNKIIGIITVLIAVAVAGGFIFNAMNKAKETEATIQTVEAYDIVKEDNTIILNGTVETTETKSFIYDYQTYGKLWGTHVTLGQYVEKDQIIVESSKKDYKAPFNGYIIALDVDNSYNQAKEAYDDDEMVEQPLVLYTIANADYYIQSSVTEYEIARLPQDKKITYEIRAESGNTVFDAGVRQLSGEPLPATGTDISTYSFTFNMLTGKDQARLGNHVTLRITDANQKPVLIPITSVIEVEGKHKVYVLESVLDNNYKVTERVVTIEEYDGQYKVIDGLLDGERIVKVLPEGITSDTVVILQGETAEVTTSQEA